MSAYHKALEKDGASSTHSSTAALMSCVNFGDAIVTPNDCLLDL